MISDQNEVTQISNRDRIKFAFNPKILPLTLITIATYFESKDITGYLVGGIVRNILLKKDITDIDIDIIVNDNPQKIGTDLSVLLSGKSTTINRSRNIVRLILHKSGPVKNIDIAPITKNILHDLQNRDFTINAIAIPIQSLKNRDNFICLIDPHNGVSDLQNGIIKLVSIEALQQDPVRLIRGVRLATQLGFDLAESAATNIRQHSHLLYSVASEKLRDELLRILAEPFPTKSIRLLDKLGLLSIIIPELDSAKGIIQPEEHYWNVFDHCLETVDAVDQMFIGIRSETNSVIRQPLPVFDGLNKYFSEQAGDGHTRLTMLKLAGLLHDISKPDTKTIEETGRIRFLGHDKIGAETVKRIMIRLRFSTEAIKSVTAMVKHHLRPSHMSQIGEMPTSRAIHRYIRDVGKVSVDTLYLNLADYLAAKGPEIKIQCWTQYCSIVNHILINGFIKESTKSKVKLIDGNDIMRTLKIESGPLVGIVLESITEAQATREVQSRKEAIALIKSKFALGDYSA